MRRMTVTLLGTAAAGSALVLSGTAIAGNVDAATGGGQVDVGTSGPGDTIAFTAKGTIDDAKGQVQYVDRENGRNVSIQHGTVSCIDAQGTVAKIAGEWRDGGTFQLYVEDNGEGKAGVGDVVAIMDGPNECEFDDPEESPDAALARGNAQVRDEG